MLQIILVKSQTLCWVVGSNPTESFVPRATLCKNAQGLPELTFVNDRRLGGVSASEPVSDVRNLDEVANVRRIAVREKLTPGLDHERVVGCEGDQPD